MPYTRSLKTYVLPEFEALPPDSWERQLRDISPIRSDLAHLRFRKFEARPDWAESPYNTRPDQPMWAVYSCTPRHLVHPERVAQLDKHWSEMPTEGEQVARKAVTSNYQHFMWHTQGVLVQPLWLLQGEFGGTPTLYSAREKRYLDASGAISEPFPPGFFTPCPFDERSVGKLIARDRLVQAGNRLDELEKMDRPDVKKAEDDAAELLFRETCLDTLAVMMAPNVEYMKSQVAKRELSALPPAPPGLENTLAIWREYWKEHGKMIGIAPPPSKKVNIPLQLTH